MNKKWFYLILMAALIYLPACAAYEPEILNSESNQVEKAVYPTQEPETVDLRLPLVSDDEISAETASKPDQPKSPPLVLVEEFYQWYLAQSGEAIFTQRTYERHPALSDIFKSDLGYLLDSFVDKSGYDPFTCSQAILPGITFESVFTSGGNAYVLAQVIVDEEVRHYFVLQLGTGDGSWKIDAIHCPFDPKTAVIGFYTGYLGHITGGNDVEAGIELPVDSFEDGFFNNFFLVSEGYRSKINAVIQEAGSAGRMSDPILETQTLPYDLWVDPGQEGEDITARLTFGPQSARHYYLHLVQSPLFYWVIDSIEMVPVPTFDPEANPGFDTSDWQVFNSEDYHFSLKFPSNWTYQEADLTDIPPEDILKESYFLYPSWADENIPILWLNILEGSESDVMNYYVTENHQQARVNQHTIWVDRDHCETRYVFQHPENQNTWVIIGDSCPTMAGRESYAEELEAIIAPLLRTMAFSSN